MQIVRTVIWVLLLVALAYGAYAVGGTLGSLIPPSVLFIIYGLFTETSISKLFLAGVDVFRINMSHSSHDNMRKTIAMIRSVEDRLNFPIGILVDLQGPKHRLGAFENGEVDVEPGHVITLDSDPAPGNAERVCLPHPEILEAMQPGHRLLINDGKVNLTVLETGDGWAKWVSKLWQCFHAIFAT